MAQAPQNFSNHRRFFPLFHYIVLPILLINFISRLVQAVKVESGWAWWDVVVAFSLAALALTARQMALAVQNRLIRLEERLRLSEVLPAAMHADIDTLTPEQLIGLRFAADAELADLVRRCQAGELTKADDVKRQVREWRPDYLRA